MLMHKSYGKDSFDKVIEEAITMIESDKRPGDSIGGFLSNFMRCAVFLISLRIKALDLPFLCLQKIICQGPS